MNFKKVKKKTAQFKSMADGEGRTGQGLRAYGHTIAEATILHIFHVPEIFVSFVGSFFYIKYAGGTMSFYR